MGNEQQTTDQAAHPAIQLEDVESSQFKKWGYDPSTETLAIEFHGYNGKPGGLYHYRHFTATEWAAARDAKSKGTYFNQNVKKFPDRYPYTRIPNLPAPAAAAE
jgi:hypothetical protein